MSQRLLETDFPSQRPSIVKRPQRPPNLNLRPISTSGSMPKNLSATDWQYEPSFRTGSMSRVQTSFDVNPNVPGRTGSLKKALTTSDEDDEVDNMSETRPLRVKAVAKPNNSHSSTSDYHSDENPNLLPVEHRELPSFRLQNFNR